MFKELIDWSLSTFSHLPWREKRSLYGTLVSEIMLQQTTVPTVIRYFYPFLERFPDIKTLSQSTDEELTVAWKGLGYYRRAKNLLKASCFISENHQGKIPVHQPDSRELLLEIPGIGPYTANALLAIGGNFPVLALDANLERILSRLFLIEDVKKEAKNVELKLEREFQTFGGRAINEALMDLGRTFCKARNPDCENCFLKKGCKAYQQNKIALYPIKKGSGSETKYALDLLRVVVQKKGTILCYQKEKHEWLSEQWEVPTFSMKNEDSSLKQYPILTHSQVEKIRDHYGPDMICFKTAITKYKITNYIIAMNEDQFLEIFAHFKKNWCFKKADTSSVNYSTSTMKVIKNSFFTT